MEIDCGILEVSTINLLKRTRITQGVWMVEICFGIIKSVSSNDRDRRLFSSDQSVVKHIRLEQYVHAIRISDYAYYRTRYSSQKSKPNNYCKVWVVPAAAAAAAESLERA